MLPTSLTRSIVEALTHVALIIVEALTHVSLAGGCVVHGGCLTAAAHGAPSLLLDLEKQICQSAHTLHSSNTAFVNGVACASIAEPRYLVHNA